MAPGTPCPDLHLSQRASPPASFLITILINSHSLSQDKAVSITNANHTTPRRIPTDRVEPHGAPPRPNSPSSPCRSLVTTGHPRRLAAHTPRPRHLSHIRTPARSPARGAFDFSKQRGCGSTARRQPCTSGHPTELRGLGHTDARQTQKNTAVQHHQCRFLSTQTVKAESETPAGRAASGSILHEETHP